MMLVCGEKSAIVGETPPSRVIGSSGYIYQRSNFKLFSSKLVDPASDHILRSKTKPCMSKTKQVVSESAYGSLNEPSPPREQSNNWITVVIQGLIMRQ